MKKFPVDIVYTWVNGNEKKWLSKKDAVLKKYGKYHKSNDVSGEKRFSNKNELKYSLRSIDRYCPWVRNIYIVTDRQKPEWINTKIKNLKIIDHTEIFGENLLPSFNSNAIEMRIKYIRGLSENFLSLNDDFFINRKTRVSDFFFEDGRPKIFVGKPTSKIKLKLRLDYPKLKKMKAHASAVYNSRKVIYKKFKKIINHNLSHSVKPLNKDILGLLEDLFQKEFNVTLNNQFRDNSDTWVMSLCAYYQIVSNDSQPVYLRKLKKRTIINRLYHFFNIQFNYGYVDLSWPLEKVKKYLDFIEKYKPFTFCLNDWPNDNKKADQLITSFLENLFPDKSKYEK